MITISSLWFMIMIELLVVTTIVSVLLIVLTVVRKQRDKKVAIELIQKVKEDGIRRVEETKKIMVNNFGFGDDKAEEIAVQVGREERKFYQNVINFYLRRDSRAFDNLNISFEGAVDPYRSIKPPGGSGASGGVMNESEEIERLNKENKRLSEEISITMQTMGRMLSEYSSMFAEGAKDKDEPAKQDEKPDVKVGDEKREEQADEKTIDSEVVAETVVAETEEDVVAEDAEEKEEEKEDEKEDEKIEGLPIVEEMDDLSDLDPRDDDLDKAKGPEDPDELLG